MTFLKLIVALVTTVLVLAECDPLSAQQTVQTTNYYFTGRKDSPAFHCVFRGKNWAINERGEVSRLTPTVFPNPFRAVDWKVDVSFRNDDRGPIVVWGDNGSFWSRVPLVASYECVGMPGTQIPRTGVEGNKAFAVNENGHRTTLRWHSEKEVEALNWYHGRDTLRGSFDGQSIKWKNGTQWNPHAVSNLEKFPLSIESIRKYLPKPRDNFKLGGGLELTLFPITKGVQDHIQIVEGGMLVNGHWHDVPKDLHGDTTLFAGCSVVNGKAKVHSLLVIDINCTNAGVDTVLFLGGNGAVQLLADQSKGKVEADANEILQNVLRNELNNLTGLEKLIAVGLKEKLDDVNIQCRSGRLELWLSERK